MLDAIRNLAAENSAELYIKAQNCAVTPLFIETSYKAGTDNLTKLDLKKYIDEQLERIH